MCLQGKKNWEDSVLCFILHIQCKPPVPLTWTGPCPVYINIYRLAAWRKTYTSWGWTMLRCGGLYQRCRYSYGPMDHFLLLSQIFGSFMKFNSVLIWDWDWYVYKWVEHIKKCKMPIDMGWISHGHMMHQAVTRVTVVPQVTQDALSYLPSYFRDLNGSPHGHDHGRTGFKKLQY